MKDRCNRDRIFHEIVFFRIRLDGTNDSTEKTIFFLPFCGYSTGVLLYKGISLLYVSERLGHASLDITTSTYAHLMKELREQDSKQQTFLNVYIACKNRVYNLSKQVY